jgi:hypothetical protein
VSGISLNKLTRNHNQKLSRSKKYFSGVNNERNNQKLSVSESNRNDPKYETPLRDKSTSRN